MQKKLAFYCSLLLAIFLIAGCGTGTDIPSSKTEVDTVSSEEQKDNKQTEELEDEDEVEVEVEKVEEEKIEAEVEEVAVETPEPDKTPTSALPKMVVHYIDVGQGDATLLEFIDEEDSYTILIDTGNWNASEVVSYLQSEKISAIDIIAITHPHADHIGQLDKIINAFDVSEVWMNGETTNSQVFARALEAIENNEVDYYEPEVGDVFDIGPLEIAVIHPTSLAGSTNNNSIAMRLQYGAISFLFTGDGEGQAEQDMLNRKENVQADILQAGHHGSKTSSSEHFLQAVNPEIVIYSASANNQYGHPHPEFINRVQSHNAELYGTDIHGTIRVETDGLTYTIETTGPGKTSEAVVAEPEEEFEEEAQAPPPASGDSCVNINEATIAEVQQIIHIGPARAPLLIEGRPYDSVDSLNKIKGIGPARITDIKAQGLACIGG